MHERIGRRRGRAAAEALLLIAVASASVTNAPAHGQVAEPLELDRPLLAYWRFDEDSGTACHDASDHGNHAAPAEGQAAGFTRGEGVFGKALFFSGRHRVQTAAGKPPFGELAEIAFSSWVLPTDLGSSEADGTPYREIFRKEDGDDRVLFSFQLDGRYLTLGLNIDGYVELRAAIDPAEVLDGRWHHAAATFDGSTMRVYLDGLEIGSMERPGTIRAGGPAAGHIGSSNGAECFQGGIDELRIYAEALSAEEIAALYHQGRTATDAHYAELREQLEVVYPTEATFSATLAEVRRRLIQDDVPRRDELASMLVRALNENFSEECRDFVDWTGIDLREYLLTPDNALHLERGRHLVELMLEYMPLTECQWERQTAEEIAQWQEAQAVADRFAALAEQGEEAAFAPEWIEVLIEMGSRIDFRPMVHEPVAPYVRPHTPETRTRSAEEAADLVRADWLYQAEDDPTPERIRSEVERARLLAERIADNYPGEVDFTASLAVLEALEEEAAGLSAADAELYFRVREVKRAIALANPVIDFDSLVFIDRPYPQGREWNHETRHRLGYMSVPGGRLLVLDGLGPDGAVRQLMPQPPLHGNFWRFDLSFDASRVLFCFMPHNEKSFHLYEIGVDGSGLRQLTDSPYDDLDPIYLPGDEHILFTTTRGHTYVRCMPPTNAFILARADRDGRNIYLVSANMEPDYLPSVMHDGRVLYSRWEYTDKPLWRAVGLWAVNPDGTQVNAVWGNQSVWPDLFKDARAIPDSRRIMFTGSAHHNWFAGSVGIVDPRRGFNFPHGLTKVTADIPWPESGDGPVDPVESPRYPRVDRPDFDARRGPYTPDGPYRAYYSPYPLSEQDFLVSADRNGKFVLYLMDVDGNRELIYEGEHHIFYAMPLRPRPEPPVIHDRVAWPARDERLHPQDGVIYSRDVYHGAPPELHGRARFLRVLNIDPKTYTYWYKRPYISTGPVISAVQSDGVKRILGTVPVEEDGSVAFYAPSGVALHFQLLDERGRALQTMPSFVNVMPGERRGCLGCHESHSATPHHDTSSFALAREPQQITPPPWGDETVSFPRFVQPILDKHCGACHQGEGEARDVVDFTDRSGFHIFSAPYMLLTGNPTWGAPYRVPENPPPGFGYADMLMVEGYDQRDPEGYSTPPPMTALSYRSRLIELVSSGEHHGVKLDGEDLERLIAWVDTMAPYRGLEEVREIDDPEFPGVDWLSVRPRVRTAPRIIRPGPVD